MSDSTPLAKTCPHVISRCRLGKDKLLFLIHMTFAMKLMFQKNFPVLFFLLHIIKEKNLIEPCKNESNLKIQMSESTPLAKTCRHVISRGRLGKDKLLALIHMTFAMKLMFQKNSPVLFFSIIIKKIFLIEPWKNEENLEIQLSESIPLATLLYNCRSISTESIGKIFVILVHCNCLINL
jgi:hypothetical protein